jgi:hypothetical protein
MGMATSMEGGHMSGAMAEFVNAQMTQSLPVAADQSLSNQINEGCISIQLLIRYYLYL